MKNSRDIENLSAYLDGQLSAADAARLEARLKTDPELDSVLSDLRVARGILKKIPARKAPRNFTLTRQMVGLKPPMPRTYPLFRLAAVFASILFLFSFTATALSPYVSFGAPTMGGYGMGGGCDGPCGDMAMESAPMEEAPAPAAAEEQLAQETTPADTAEDGTRITESEPSATMKEGGEGEFIGGTGSGGPAAEEPNQIDARNEATPSYIWSIIFLVIGIASGLVMWVMRLAARNRWR